MGRLDAAFDGVVNFVELRHGEVRRIPQPVEKVVSDRSIDQKSIRTLLKRGSNAAIAGCRALEWISEWGTVVFFTG